MNVKQAVRASNVIDKAELIRIVDELNAKLGIVRDPSVTGEDVQALMLANGIRPEDRILSSELQRMRYPDDEL